MARKSELSLGKGGGVQRAHRNQRHGARPGHRHDLDTTESVRRGAATEQEINRRTHTYLRQFKNHARQNNRLGINIKDM